MSILSATGYVSHHRSTQLTWRQEREAPQNMTSSLGAATPLTSLRAGMCILTHYIYSQRCMRTELQQCGYECFTLAVINNKVTTIGGWSDVQLLTHLLLGMEAVCLDGEQIGETPSLQYQRLESNQQLSLPRTHLIAAGGMTRLWWCIIYH